MKTHTIAITVFIAAALAAAAILVTSREKGKSAPSDGAGQLVLPALAEKLNDAGAIQIRRGTDLFTFKRTALGWALAEKHDFPAKAENIRSLLISLAELKTVEPKTSKPELYPKIGVQDPGASSPTPAPDTLDGEPPTQPALVSVKDIAGAELGSIIIGTQKWGAAPEVYIRRSGEAQSWLAAGRIDVPWDALAWVDRSVIDIPRDKWRAVAVTHPDGETIGVTKIDASQKSFFIENIPSGRELTSPTAGDSLGGVFAGLTLDDVKPTATLDPAAIAAATRTVGTTFDGLTITARTVDLDGKKWVTFEASAASPDEQPEASKQADQINARLAAWAFAVSEFKSKALLTRWSDVLKPVEAPAPPATEPSDAGAEAPVAPPSEPAP